MDWKLADVKWKNKFYLLSFLGGVIVINIFGAEANTGMLNRYSLAALSFGQIRNEEYLIELLFLRLRTVLGLWIASKFVPSKWVMLIFAFIMCSFMGGIVAMSIMENGLWGILFCATAFFPHAICYGMAYSMWSSLCAVPNMCGNRKEGNLFVVFLMILIGIGIVLEAYISPVLIKNIIKY